MDPITILLGGAAIVATVAIVAVGVVWVYKRIMKSYSAEEELIELKKEQLKSKEEILKLKKEDLNSKEKISKLEKDNEELRDELVATKAQARAIEQVLKVAKFAEISNEDIIRIVREEFGINIDALNPTDPITAEPLDDDCVLGGDGRTYNRKTLHGIIAKGGTVYPFNQNIKLSDPDLLPKNIDFIENIKEIKKTPAYCLALTSERNRQKELKNNSFTSIHIGLKKIENSFSCEKETEEKGAFNDFKR
jgi:hypothetical protein